MSASSRQTALRARRFALLLAAAAVAVGIHAVVAVAIDGWSEPLPESTPTESGSVLKVHIVAKPGPEDLIVLGQAALDALVAEGTDLADFDSAVLEPYGYTGEWVIAWLDDGRLVKKTGTRAKGKSIEISVSCPMPAPLASVRTHGLQKDWFRCVKQDGAWTAQRMDDIPEGCGMGHPWDHHP
jgi:hypothetical protein